ncbi:MAG: hypothetical protein ABSH28_09145, partial [Acidobacteriota bacterium]
KRIALGADWAWLLSPRIDKVWAGEWLAKCGAEPGKLNVGVNLVNEIWQSNRKMKIAWAELLDRIAERFGAQIVFFCNESRPGEYFDRAAAEDIRARMRRPSILVPNQYFQAVEMISLVSLMRATISQRYHFTMFSVLANVYPISIQRGQKMRGLNEELGLPYLGDMEQIDAEGIEEEIDLALKDPEAKLRPLEARQKHLETRARNNLALLKV